MTAQQRKALSSGSTLDHYRAFHRAADGGDFRKAFAILKAQPHLVTHMTLLEMPCHCAIMSHKLSEAQMRWLIQTFQNHLKSMQRMLRMARQYDRVAREHKRRRKSD